MISRRDWLCALAFGGTGTLLARAAAAQQDTSGQLVDTSNLFAMDQAAARSVRLPPKPNAAPSMTPDDRDALEHRVRCQCGCTLDVYTCRTTDFTCQVSPAMHRDVMALVAGGYSADEIIAAFVDVYGERVLMAPPRVGFNVLGYVLPGIVLGAGAILLAALVRRWRHVDAPHAPAAALPVNASADELARLDAAIRDDA